MSQKLNDEQQNPVSIQQMSIDVTNGIEAASEVVKDNQELLYFLWNCQQSWITMVSNIIQVASNFASLANRDPEEVVQVLKQWSLRYEAEKAKQGGLTRLTVDDFMAQS